jgi:hypothetical protein
VIDLQGSRRQTREERARIRSRQLTTGGGAGGALFAAAFLIIPGGGGYNFSAACKQHADCVALIEGDKDIGAWLNKLPSETQKMALGAAAIKNLPQGKIVLAAPEKMVVGETKEVSSKIGINVPSNKLKFPVAIDVQTQEGVLLISREMAADLSGAGFDITAQSPRKQPVTTSLVTAWNWTIKANEAGPHELTVTMRAVLADTGDEGQQIDTYSTKIEVAVKEESWSEWVVSRGKEFGAVKTAIAAVILAVSTAIGMYGWWRGKRPEQEKKDDEDKDDDDDDDDDDEEKSG